jgi:hypothetical protein
MLPSARAAEEVWRWPKGAMAGFPVLFQVAIPIHPEVFIVTVV